MTFWRRWLSRPQTTALRQTIFQLHLWSGIGLGLYILVASVTGSILVFSNELYRAATPAPVIVSDSGPPLTDAQLKAAAERAYPGYTTLTIGRARNPAQAVIISLNAGGRLTSARAAAGGARPAGNKHSAACRGQHVRVFLKTRLFNPYTGADLGDSVPPAIRLISKLMELHDDLLAGPTGRRVNGVGAIMLIVLALTGIVVWWPGVATWRRSLTVHRNVGWRRFTWDLHSMIGFWTLGFLLLFGVSGAYLGNPQAFQDLADRIQPATPANAGVRTVDQIVYWLAYLHFGRVNGIGIPCTGPGFCDAATKLTWALLGLAPTVMFATGAVMWWNRVVRTKLRRTPRPPIRTETIQLPPN